MKDLAIINNAILAFIAFVLCIIAHYIAAIDAKLDASKESLDNLEYCGALECDEGYMKA